MAPDLLKTSLKDTLNLTSCSKIHQNVDRKIILNSDTFRKKVYGCWLGKAIGGTLGMPKEGQSGPFNLTYFDPIPKEPVPNDDLDLQLMWLMLLRRHGGMMSLVEMGRGWREHSDFPWDEYGVAWSNLSRHIFAPASGHHGNVCGDCMGSPIRSEIWATLAAGDPELAAKFAYNDAIQDHDGEGIWGEVFFATIESAAYVMNDRDRLLQLGLSAIPNDCRTYKAVTSTLRWYEQDRDWGSVREKILQNFGHENFTDGPQNFAFTILGWLHGKDFGDCLCTAVNCGQDSDCTAATLGSILGILDPESISEKWKEPISSVLKVSAAVKNLDLPKTLEELTDMTVETATQILKECSDKVQLSMSAVNKSQITLPLLTPIPCIDPNTIVLTQGDLEISAFYPKGLDFIPGEELELILRFTNHGPTNLSARLRLELPADWGVDQRTNRLSLAPGATKTYTVTIIPSINTRVHTVTGGLVVEKDGIRAEYPVPFVSCWPWTLTVEGQKKIVWLPERTIPLPKNPNFPVGTRINLSSSFHLSRKQRMRIVLAYRGAGSLSIDGEKIIEYTQGYFLPFAHRTPPEICKDVLMTEGSHRVDVELVIDADRSNAAVVFADAYSYHIIYDLTFR